VGLAPRVEPRHPEEARLSLARSILLFAALAILGAPASGAEVSDAQLEEVKRLLEEERFDEAITRLGDLVEILDNPSPPDPGLDEAAVKEIKQARLFAAVSVHRSLAVAYFNKIDLDRADDWLERTPGAGFGDDTYVHRARSAVQSYEAARVAAGLSDSGGIDLLDELKDAKADALWNYARGNADAYHCGIADDVLKLLEVLEPSSCRAHGMRVYCRRECGGEESCRDVIRHCVSLNGCTLAEKHLPIRAAMQQYCDRAKGIVYPVPPEPVPEPEHEYSKVGVTVSAGIAHAYSSAYLDAGVKVHVNVYKGLELDLGGGDAMRRSPLPSPPATWQFVHLPWAEGSVRFRADRFRVKPYGKLAARWFFSPVYADPFNETAVEWETEFSILGGGGIDVMLDPRARHWYANVDLQVGGILFSAFEDVPVLLMVRAGVGYRF